MSFQDATSIIATKTEDENSIKGNTPLLHDVKAINTNSAKLPKTVYIWFFCNVTLPRKMHVFNYQVFNEVILGKYGVKWCVQTLWVAFWVCFGPWVEFIRPDRCLSARLG